jgi:hypothetical protein
MRPVLRPLNNTLDRLTHGGFSVLDPKQEAALDVAHAFGADGGTRAQLADMVAHARQSGASPYSLAEMARLLPNGGQNTLRVIQRAMTPGGLPNDLFDGGLNAGEREAVKTAGMSPLSSPEDLHKLFPTAAAPPKLASMASGAFKKALNAVVRAGAASPATGNMAASSNSGLQGGRQAASPLEASIGNGPSAMPSASAPAVASVALPGFDPTDMQSTIDAAGAPAILDADSGGAGGPPRMGDANSAGVPRLADSQILSPYAQQVASLPPLSSEQDASQSLASPAGITPPGMADAVQSQPLPQSLAASSDDATSPSADGSWPPFPPW